MTPDGWTVHHHATVASTNDLATSLAIDGAEEGTVVWADAQSAGRGRSGRNWSSPTGNLYCSVVLRPGPDLANAANLSFVVAVALRAAIADVCDHLSPGLKWPNDILLSGKKLCGILLESGLNGGPHVIAGTGINVSSEPPGLNDTSTCLAKQGCAANPHDLLSSYLFALANRLAIWRESGFAAIRSEWLDHAIGLGEPITARTDTGSTAGTFENLNADGALVLRTANGDRATILAADVFFGRTGASEGVS